MPNIQFDFFYDNDVFNFTASRSGGVPKVKPEWKVRTAPKLAPKEKSDTVTKPNRPATKSIPKPTVQSKSAPVVPKKPPTTIKNPGAKKPESVNGVA